MTWGSNLNYSLDGGFPIEPRAARKGKQNAEGGEEEPAEDAEGAGGTHDFAADPLIA
jgi:hypothetical protein